MGREVTLKTPERDDDFFPKGPASLCVDLVPGEQCYTAPKEFGNNPEAEVIQLDRNTEALFFSAESGGVSGFSIHFALLRPGMNRTLENILPGDSSVSNQSQHAFWNEPSISDSRIFVTASDVWGPNEGHYGEHRYIITAYVRQSPTYTESASYWLTDRYMTASFYDLESADILKTEKPEILARLRRVKTEIARRARITP